MPSARSGHFANRRNPAKTQHLQRPTIREDAKRVEQSTDSNSHGEGDGDNKCARLAETRKGQQPTGCEHLRALSCQVIITRVRFPSLAPLIINDLHRCAGKVQENFVFFKPILSPFSRAFAVFGSQIFDPLPGCSFDGFSRANFRHPLWPRGEGSTEMQTASTSKLV
jgi:hypothetical protein